MLIDFKNPGEEIQRISVYVRSEEESNVTKEIMGRISNNDIHFYNGVITGFVNPEMVRAIMQKGLMIDSTSIPEIKIPKVVKVDFQAKEKVLKMKVNDNATVKSYHVTLSGPLNHAIRKRLADLKITMMEACGENIYYMLLNNRQSIELEKEDFFLSMVEEKSKASPKIMESWQKAKEAKEFDAEIRNAALLNVRSPISGKKKIYDINVFRKEDLPLVRNMLEDAQDAKILEATDTALRISVSPSSEIIGELNKTAVVRSILEYNAPKLFCNASRILIGCLSATRKNIFSWDGTGELIGVLDSGMDLSHHDLQDAVKHSIEIPGGSKNDLFGHGTHVAGIIAGRGVDSGGKVMGIAPGTDLINVAMTDTDGKLLIPLDYRNILDPAIKKGAKILNLSWGKALEGDYDNGSRQIDEYVFNNPNVLIVVAAGNSGSAPEGKYKPHSLYAPASAKNVVTVGALNSKCDKVCVKKDTTWNDRFSDRFLKPPASTEKMCQPPILPAALSSRGPTVYDSIKPDLIAPGTFIESTKSKNYDNRLYETGCITQGDTYAVLTGTSMAAPFVSGMAAIIRQFLKEKYNTPNPSAALMKALLIASAQYIDYNDDEEKKVVGYPDFAQGFGLINLPNILIDNKSGTLKLLFHDVSNKSPEALASRMPLDSDIKSYRSYNIEVPERAKTLHIVLTWTDPPGVAIQNNMQLDVTGPGIGLPGNHEHNFHKDPLFDKLNNSGIPFDKKNTVEIVRIKKPKKGTYQIRVIAENTSNPNQGYAVVFIGKTLNKQMV
ncbi:MAG: S8 family serine peptidase [Ferruginibacter sp.]